MIKRQIAVRRLVGCACWYELLQSFISFFLFTPLAMQFIQLHRSPGNSSMAGGLLSQLESSTRHMISSGGVEL